MPLYDCMLCLIVYVMCFMLYSKLVYISLNIIDHFIVSLGRMVKSKNEKEVESLAER